MEKNSFKCAICGKTIVGEYGNNPWPIQNAGKCCDECNLTKVIPARLRHFIENRK